MKFLKNITISFSILVFSLTNISATEIQVPGNQPNALANAITGATTGDILLLEAGKAYPNEGKLVIDKELTIKAVGTIDKATDKARIVQIPNQSGDRSSQTVELQASVTFINIYFDGRRTIAGSDIQLLRSEQPGISIVIDSCIFDRSEQTAIRLNKSTDRFILTNSIFLNMAHGTVSEGRGVDLREGPHKYVMIQNNTFTNAEDRYIRHLKWGQNLCPAVDTLIVDHNTFNQGLGYRPNFQFSSVKHLQFTNNLIINPAMLGTDSLSNRVGEITWMAPEAVTYLGPNAITIFNISEAATYNTEIIMKNNNVWIDPSVTDILNTTDKVEPAPLFNNEMKAVLGADTATATFSDPVTFTMPGDLHLEFVQQYRDMIDTVTVPGQEINPNAALNAQNKYFYLNFGVDTLDLSYNTDAASYTAADNGFPLGDLNWFPDKKNEWITGISEKSVSGNLPKEFSLSQNYPNPFNPSTKISFNIPKSGNVRLSVYNVLGQEVSVLVNERLNAGIYEYKFNAANLTSGLYFYKLESEGQVQIKKMMLIK